MSKQPNEQRLNHFKTRNASQLESNLAAGITTPTEATRQFGIDLKAQVTAMRENRLARTQSREQSRSANLQVS